MKYIWIFWAGRELILNRWTSCNFFLLRARLPVERSSFISFLTLLRSFSTVRPFSLSLKSEIFLVGFLRRFIVSQSWLFYLLSLVGVPSFFMSTLTRRSIAICAGVSIGILTHFAIFWGTKHCSSTLSGQPPPSSGQPPWARYCCSFGWSPGLYLLSLCLQYAWYAFVYVLFSELS